MQGLKPTKRDAYGRLILGDIITSVNGKKVTNGSDLYRILDQCKVGDKVPCIYLFDLFTSACLNFLTFEERHHTAFILRCLGSNLKLWFMLEWIHNKVSK